jgi:hypothetical protein
MIVLSPEGRGGAAEAPLAMGLRSIHDVVVALHDNGKPGAAVLLAGIAGELAARGAKCRRWSKPHAARPSHHIEEMAAKVDAAVVALGD